MLPQQAYPTHLALDGARHTIEQAGDFLVGVSLNLPQRDLPQLRLDKQVEQTPAFIRHLGGFLRSRLTAEEVLDIVVVGNLVRLLLPYDIDGPRDGARSQEAPKLISIRHLDGPIRILHAPAQAMKRSKSDVFLLQSAPGNIRKPFARKLHEPIEVEFELAAGCRVASIVQ